MFSGLVSHAQNKSIYLFIFIITVVSITLSQLWQYLSQPQPTQPDHEASLDHRNSTSGQSYCLRKPTKNLDIIQ